MLTIPEYPIDNVRRFRVALHMGIVPDAVFAVRYKALTATGMNEMFWNMRSAKPASPFEPEPIIGP